MGSRKSARRLGPLGRFALNGLWLIGVNLFMRTVGVSFGVYLSNRAGGEVMGLHALLGGVYAFAMTLGSGGVHLGTSRLVAETMGRFCPAGEGRPAEDTVEGLPCRRAIRRVMGTCLAYAWAVSAATGALLFLAAPHVGEAWLGDGRTVLPLRVLALTLPPVAVSACLGGYFTAVRRVGKNAAVGIGAQLLRVGFCAYLLTLWLPRGVEMTCLALVLGGALSELCGLILNLLSYLWDKHRHLRVMGRDGQGEAAPPATGALLGITVPVTLSACLRSGLVTLQHILIPRGLKRSGASWEAALASYGVLHGMVLPVVLFPSAFISSFSGLLVPEVAEAAARGDGERVARMAYKSLTPALIFSFGVAGVMACFGNELGVALYGSGESGFYIRLLAPLIPIMYVDSTVDAFLKGLGEQVYSMNINILDAGVSVLLVWLLLPSMGIAGYVVAIYVTETLNTVLSLCRMLRVSGMVPRLWKQVFGPMVCILGATSVCRMGGMLFHLPIEGVAELTLHMLVCVGLYALLLAVTGVFGKEELGAYGGLLRG